jgi:hypothetical protein
MDGTIRSQMQLQRFISILCRYPIFELEEDEEEETTLRMFKERGIAPSHRSRLTTVKWEERTLRRRGGYSVITNNIFHPNDDDSKPQSDGSRPVSSSPSDIYKYDPLKPVLAGREFCVHHSEGHLASFHGFLKEFSQRSPALIGRYKTDFPIADLLARAEEFDAPTYADVLRRYDSILQTEHALKGHVKEFGWTNNLSRYFLV